MRTDGRSADELRPLSFELDYTRYAEGSVLTKAGNTLLLCSAMVTNDLPLHRKDSGGGWLSAEYSMLPSANRNRKSHYAKVSGRNMEIQRLIGRSLRAVVDLNAMGPKTIWIDCDIIQADGGTRTAAISGGFVALMCALRAMKAAGLIHTIPMLNGVAAVSVGIVAGEPVLDLCYEEDSQADVDMNIVATHDGKFIEIQGTAERESFSSEQLQKMLSLASAGIAGIKERQLEVLGGLED